MIAFISRKKLGTAGTKRRFVHQRLSVPREMVPFGFLNVPLAELPWFEVMNVGICPC
jgi:hypothetical protein